MYKSFGERVDVFIFLKIFSFEKLKNNNFQKLNSIVGVANMFNNFILFSFSIL